MPGPEPLRIDVVSDVVCPWCFIGKRRLEKAIALRPDIPVSVHYRPYFLNPWVPREGISREEYLTTKFGSVERYKANAQRIVAAAREEGLAYNLDAIARQPNTADCHRLILWSEATGDPARMKQRLMDLYFTEGADLSDPEVLVGAARDCGMDADEVRSLARDRQGRRGGGGGSQGGEGRRHRRGALLHFRRCSGSVRGPSTGVPGERNGACGRQAARNGLGRRGGLAPPGLLRGQLCCGRHGRGLTLRWRPVGFDAGTG